MSVNQRIKFLVDEVYEGKTSHLAKAIGVAASVISSLMPDNRSNAPSFEVLNKILDANHKGNFLNTDWLVKGIGQPFKNAILPAAKSQEPKSQMPAVVTVDSQGRDNIALVNIKARAGYLMGYADPEFIEMLPTYRLPGIDNGTFRMWEVEGSSMIPTLHHRNIVIAEWVETPDHMRDERIYVIVTHTEGVVIKRCINRLNKYGYILAKSDNGNKFDYPDLEIKQEDIKEIWYPRLYISARFTAPSDLYNRMTNLEVEMHQLRNLLS